MVYISAQFEQCGEAAIKLLTKSVTSNLRMFGFGFSWSAGSYSGSASWQYALPDELKNISDKQQYAAWFGSVTSPVVWHDDLGKLKSQQHKVLSARRI